MSNPALFFSALAIFLWGAGAIFEKLSLTLLAPKAAFFSRFYLAFVLLFPFLVMTWEGNKAAMQQGGRMAFFYLASGMVCTVGGVYFYYHALSLSEASRVVPLCASYPLVAFGAALLFLNEPFTASKMLGALFVAVGIFFLNR